MSLNAPGIHHRTPDHEDIDARERADNWLKESWKNWPNDAHYTDLTEQKGPVHLNVKGNIPSWAAGSLFRTGPGKDSIKDTPRGTFRMSHWFDGIAQTHRFDIVPPHHPDGRTEVIYSSRSQSEAIVEQIKAKGWHMGNSFGQKADPCLGIFSKFMSVFEPRETTFNVAVLPNMPGFGEPIECAKPGGHRSGAKNLFAVTDNAGYEMIDPKTLEPVGKASQAHLHPELKGPLSCAHAQRDPENGDMFNFNIDIARKDPIYRIFRVNASTGTTDILASVSGPAYRPAYIHSFFLTENYVVLCVTAAHYAWGGMKIVWEKNIIDSIKPFNREDACRWVVVDRRHGRGVVAEFATRAAFFFHSVNAFEEVVCDDESGEKHTELNLDQVLYDNTDIMHNFYYDVLLDRDGATKKCMLEKEWYKTCQHRLVRHRFRMPGRPQTRAEAASATAEEVFSIPSPHAGELPTINPSRGGRPYRYAYAASTRGLCTFMDSLVKTDLATREALLWAGPEAHSPGEPIFVPRPGATDEDDGVVLSLVLDGVERKSYLLCLDARTMREVGRAEADFAIAIGLHGAFQMDGGE